MSKPYMNVLPISRQRLINIIRETPGITTPELAERLGVSVTYARWAVYEVGGEFFDGNHIRIKDGAHDQM